jgi:hypothetical protein
MGFRQIVDPQGTPWDVWDVAESVAPRGRHLAHVAPELTRGWLCFRSPREKRRLTPIPNNWMTLRDDDLWRLCETAAPARRSGPHGSVAEPDQPPG